MTSLADFNYRYYLSIRRKLIYAIGILVLSFGLVVFAVIPAIQDIFKHQATIQKKKKDVAALQAKLLTLEQAETIQVVENSDLINSALLSKKPLLELMNSLSYVSHQADIKIDSIELTPGEISTESGQIKQVSRSRNSDASLGYESLNVSLVISGDLQNINQFIQTVERMIPVTDVMSITLNERQFVSAEGQKEVSYESEIDLSTYYFTKTVQAAIDTPLAKMDGSEQEFLEELKTYYYPIFNPQFKIEGGGSTDFFKIGEELDKELELLQP